MAFEYKQPNDVLISSDYLRIVIDQFFNNFYWVIVTIHDSFLNCSYLIKSDKKRIHHDLNSEKSIKLGKNG